MGPGAEPPGKCFAYVELVLKNVRGSGAKPPEFFSHYAGARPGDPPPRGRPGEKRNAATKCLILCKGWYLSFEETFFKKKVLRTWGKIFTFI